MEWLDEIGRRIEMLLHRKQFRADLDEEMQLHLDLRTQDLRQKQQAEQGVNEIEARHAAKRKFGNPTVLKEESATAWGWRWLESLAQDALYGVRAMMRSPGITAVALLSLALGIGATTAIYTLMDTVMLRSLPVKDPGSLVLVGTGEDDGISDEFGNTDLYSYPNYRKLQKENQVFSDVAAVFSMTNDAHGYVTGRSEQEPIQVQLVSGTYFDTLGVQALMGRMLTDQDDNSEGGHPNAVISYSWWTRALARDPAALGKTLRIGSTVFTIVGVAPPEFFGTKVGVSPDVWIPMSMMEAVPPHWKGYSDATSEGSYIIGRLKPGVSLEQATANVNVWYLQTFRQLVGSFKYAVSVQSNLARLDKLHVPLTPMATGLSEVRREFSKPLRILMAVVVLVLLIACANIANLLLARGTARSRELAVRQALGAGRLRIARQLLTESVVLALAGGAMGVGIAAGATRLLLHMVSSGGDQLPLDISMNTNLLLFTLAVTLSTALLFGTVPAVRATRLQLTDSLKDGRGTSEVGTKGVLARGLIVSQIALSLALLVGAGLFLRSLVNLNHVDTGFNRENVLLLKLDEGSAGYQNRDPRLSVMHREVEERVSALPGVRAASYSMFTFHEGSWNGPVYVAGFNNNIDVDVRHNIIGNGYFATMGISLIAGRSFGPQDTATSQKVALVSERMARTMFRDGDALGQHYGVEGPNEPRDIEVIGIVKDVKYNNVDEMPKTLDYLPYAQYPGYLNDFEVRYAGDPGAVSAAVQKAMNSIDRNVPVVKVMTLGERIASTVRDERLVAQLCTFFGLLSVFLSSIGIYGLMSYLVSRRTNEIGIRMALGAESSHVRWMVMRDMVWLVVVGVAIGAPVALMGSRLVTSMLYGLGGTDLVSLFAAIGLLLAVTVFAGYLPARRASRVDPVVALRYE
jgi:predicted permease